MVKVCLILFALCALSFAQQQFADIRSIDSFDKTTEPIIILVPNNPSFPITSETTVTGTSADRIIGNTRTLRLDVLSGNPESVLSTSVTNDKFHSTCQQLATGRTLLQYDGGSSSTLVPGGLLEVGVNTDFTQSGAYAIHTIIESDQPTDITFRIYSGSASNYCNYVLSVPGDDTLHDYFLNYNEFDFVGSGCSFTNVGAVEVEVALLQNVDVIIELLSIYGPVAVSGTPSRTRSPSMSPVVPSASQTPTATPSPINRCECQCPVFVCEILRHDEYVFYQTFYDYFFNFFFDFYFFFFDFYFFFYDFYFFFGFFDFWYWFYSIFF